MITMYLEWEILDRKKARVEAILSKTQVHKNLFPVHKLLCNDTGSSKPVNKSRK
jgi:hypothetical protein